jgi:hypothetical protein
MVAFETGELDRFVWSCKRRVLETFESLFKRLGIPDPTAAKAEEHTSEGQSQMKEGSWHTISGTRSE